MMDFSSVNVTTVVVAAVVSFIIGFLWHGPLFGKQWIKMMHIPQHEVDAMRKKGMGAMMPQMLASLVQQIVMAAVVSSLAMALNVVDSAGAVLLAIVLWLGFIATVQLNAVLWERRKLNLYLFNVVYHLVSLVVMTLIVVMWK
jgi:hypothetical protein